MPATRLRNLRVDDDLWVAAGHRAQREGLTMSELIRGWLAEYVEGDRPDPGAATPPTEGELVALVRAWLAAHDAHDPATG
jgi:hypothetical protein